MGYYYSKGGPPVGTSQKGSLLEHYTPFGGQSPPTRGSGGRAPSKVVRLNKKSLPEGQPSFATFLSEK